MENRNASALIFNGKDKPIEKNSFPLPVKLSDYEVLVSISLSTVCGSDVHTWLGHRSFPTPSVMGHEMVGVIEDIGSNCHWYCQLFINFCYDICIYFRKIYFCFIHYFWS